MNTFSLVQRALDASLADETKQGLSDEELELGRITAAVQTVVDALTPPDGGRYLVGFSNISTAQTSLGERRITVSSKPLRDRNLTMVEKAVVVATFAAHEIGHTLVTRPRKGLVAAHNPHSGFHAVANVADDIILEPVMVDRFPILADAFEFTGAWVLRSTSTELPKVLRLTRGMTTPERFNVLLSATRYGDIPEIVFADAATMAERDWSRDWAGRLIATPLTDHDTFLALCDEAWLRVRTEPDVPEPPVIEEPPTQPTDEDGDEDGDDEDGEDGTEDGDDATDEQGDDATDDDGDTDQDDGESEDEDSESEDEDSESTDEGGTEPSDEGGDEADANDQPRDWDDDDDDTEDGEGEDDESEPGTEQGEDESESDSEGDDADEGEDDGDPIGTDPAESEIGETDATNDPGDDAEGGGGNPNVRDEDDFNERETDKSMHEQSEPPPYDWDAQRIEQAARNYASMTTTAFGKHGAMPTTWE